MIDFKIQSNFNTFNIIDNQQCILIQHKKKNNSMIINLIKKDYRNLHIKVLKNSPVLVKIKQDNELIKKVNSCSCLYLGFYLLWKHFRKRNIKLIIRLIC